MLSRILCTVLVLCGSAFGRMNEGCVSSCDKGLEKDKNACMVDYLSALMKCDPKCQTCFDKATADYIHCINAANDSWIACVGSCEDIPEPPDKEECIAECDVEKRKNDMKCFDAWSNKYIECHELSDEQDIRFCMEDAEIEYQICRTRAENEHTACVSGCE